MKDLNKLKDHSSFYTAAKDGKEGAWVGIDLGTSNCACAIWDSTRGRPKLLQLREISRPRKGKIGRIVPSAVLLGQGNLKIGGVKARVGYPVLQLQEQEDSDVVLKACVTSVKRLIGTAIEDKEFLAAFPFDIAKEDDGSISILVTPLGSSSTIRLSPLQILSIILTSIRLASEEYLGKFISKKKMKVPGSTYNVVNCVIGVPANFGQRQRHLFEQACKLAGFTGHVSTITESTAASLAYGLFVSVPVEKHILVFDMGGGTTDVTIAKLTPDEDFTVLATQGERLGGDEMDEAILEIVLFKLQDLQPTSQDRKRLSISCRRCKERLSGTDEDMPVESCSVVWDGRTVFINQEEFNNALKPLINRARNLVRTIVKRSGHSIHEVALVGGATRVPAVRQMLLKEFPSIPDLCVSLNPEGAVAQGCAIQAAIRSGLVPLSELKSALMLDALPHPIGVLLPDHSSYVPILEKDMQLPAMGYATFTLSDVRQPGVTVVAVEDVGNTLEKVGEFNFLLHRLSDEEYEQLGGLRTVDIGFTMQTSGEFIVSVFDENDPEHLRKKERYIRQQGGEIGYDEKRTKAGEAIDKTLILACIILFVLYIAAKLAFHEAEVVDDAINKS
jgi:molecular chaperone DnaK (HSP70)